MKAAMTDDKTHESRLREVRVANLAILKQGKTQYHFGLIVKFSQSAIAQFMNGMMPLTRSACARMEEELGLANGAMDVEGGVSPLIDQESGSVTPAQRSSPEAATQGSFEGQSRRFNVRPSTAMHYVLLDSLAKLLASGQVGDDQCRKLLTKFTLMRAGRNGQRDAEVDGILARLAINEFRVVYTGEGQQEEAVNRLNDEFDPAFASSVSRYLVDASQMPEEMRREFCNLVGS